ncbi:MAG: anaerobic ribonucleoside-triphosphate reductase activating protein [Candidatus Moraniibacteriota bacterium]
MIQDSNLQFDTRGLEKFSLVEWPGKMTAIIFTGGCNFRCPFCHNPELVTDLDKTPIYPWEEIDKFLDKKKGWIDAIMITGGEPTIHPDLLKILKIIKDKGYLTGIATNGSNPEMIKELIDEALVNKICMDIKSSIENYPIACGQPIMLSSWPLSRDPEKDFKILSGSSGRRSPTSTLPENDKKSGGHLIELIKNSIEIIKNSGIEYEFKLTVVPDIVTKEDIPKIGEMIKGAKKIVLQQFRPLKTLDKSYQSKVPHCRDEIIEMAKELEKYVEEVNLDFID